MLTNLELDFPFKELTHQLQNTTAKVVLAHPSYLKTALAAALEAGIPRSRVFQFSDEENPTREGIPDWRTMIGSPAQGEVYRWPDLSLSLIHI